MYSRPVIGYIFEESMLNWPAVKVHCFSQTRKNDHVAEIQ